MHRIEIECDVTCERAGNRAKSSLFQENKCNMVLRRPHPDAVPADLVSHGFGGVARSPRFLRELSDSDKNQSCEDNRPTVPFPPISPVPELCVTYLDRYNKKETYGKLTRRPQNWLIIGFITFLCFFSEAQNSRAR